MIPYSMTLITVPTNIGPRAISAIFLAMAVRAQENPDQEYEQRGEGGGPEEGQLKRCADDEVLFKGLQTADVPFHSVCVTADSVLSPTHTNTHLENTLQLLQVVPFFQPPWAGRCR